jgi:hypothetical protein
MLEERTIIEAIEQLKTTTGIKAHWRKTAPKELDGTMVFEFNGNQYVVYIEAKTGFRNYQLPMLMELKKKYQPLMIIAEHIFPKIKEELRTLGIGYLETNGNIFFKYENIFLWNDGQKRIEKHNTKLGRAFTKTGLKLLFHFLLNEDLVNKTYREIAIETGVGFGNINFIITDLKQQDYLIPLDKDNYKLINKKELLNKWMDGYEVKLKPDLLIGTFRFLKDQDFLNWKMLPIQKKKTWWGGEPAGDLLTKYLRPAELTLYTIEKRNELIKHYKLIPDEKGNVKVYQKFWQHDDGDKNVVPPLLAYADLMNTGDRRCIETAQKVYDGYLQDKF